MATEISIPKSICLKKGEREDNAVSSEILEANVTQLLVNKVKQLESGPNQPLETSSQVIETVNTQLETGIPTDESGTFFPALSITKVAADEHINTPESNTPESCEATTTEDQEVRKMTDTEAFTEGKPNEEPVVAIASKEAFANEQQSNKGDHELVEAIPAQSQGSIGNDIGKELEVTDISYKDESVDGSLSTEIEAVNNEGKEPEFVKTKESVKEDTEDVTLGVETEHQGLHEGATDHVCVSTDTKHEKETIKNEEETSETKKAGEESSPEKAELELSDSIVPSKKEALNTLDIDQGDSEGITSSQNVTCEDTKEAATGQHENTVAEQDQNERPREPKEQIEDKLIAAQEASEVSEAEVKDKGVQKTEVSVKKTEEEEEFEKIRPSNEIEEKMDQNGLVHAITADDCISTQTKSQVDTVEHEKKGEEEATQIDDGQKEKSDSPTIKDVCEDNSSEKVEHEKEQEVNVLDKDKDPDEVGITSTQDISFEGGMVTSKQEVLDKLKKDQGDSEGVTSSQNATCEDIKETTTGEHATTVAEQDQNERSRELIKEQIQDTSIDVQEASKLSEEIKGKEEQKLEVSVKKTEEEEEIEKITPSIEIEENMDQNGLLHAITTDACISTQTESQSQVDNIEHEKKGEEEATQSDDAQKEKSDSPSIMDVCEDDSSEKVEHEKKQEVSGLDQDQDQNEAGITSKQDVVFEGGMVPSKKEALDTLERDQGDIEGVTSSQAANCEDIKETTTGQHATTEEEQDQNERPRELIQEHIEDKSIDAHEAIEQYEDEVMGKGEQKPEESVKKIEEERETEKIRTSVEIKKMDEQKVLHANKTDACISTQTQTQADTIEHGKDEEEATESDDGQKEKSDNPPIKEVCEENSSEKVEHEKEQEVNMLDKDQDEVDNTSTQDVAFEGDLQEKNHQSEGNTVSTGACISTQTEPHEETIENEEKNDVIESDDGNTKSSGSPVVKEICEETVAEKAVSDEVLKSSDSFSVVLNENEIVCKDEDQEKEQVLYMSQKSQSESEVKTTKLEERRAEKVIESNDSQNESSDDLSIKEVCEDTESEKVEPETEKLSDSSSIELNEKAVAILNKDEVQGKEQDQITCSEDATSIEELQGKNHEDTSKEPESDMIRERSLEVDYGEIASTVETEYQGSSHDGITTDVCVSTQTELEKESSKNEEKAIEMEVCKDTSADNAESEARLELSDNMASSKKESLNTLEKDQGDSEGVTSSQDATCEDTKERTLTQCASVGADFKEQDQNERPREFLKEETEDKSIDAQKASKQCEHGENDKKEDNLEKSVKHDNQQKEQEVIMLEEDIVEDNVTSAQDVPIKEGLQEKSHHSEAANAKESIEEDIEEIRSAVEITEQQTLINTNATDVCISTQTEPEEATTENEDKNNEEAIGSEDGKLEKSGSPMIKEINEETVSEKAESKDGLKSSESPGILLNENESLSKDEDQEKEQELYVSERGESGEDDVTSSKNASNEDIKETTIGEHVTTVACFKEGQDLSATPKEIIKEEAEDKPIDAQEATEQCDDVTKDDLEQKEEESVNEIARSSPIIEEAGYTEEIKPSVDTNEQKDVCTSTKIESQEQVTKNELKAIEIDVAQMEKSDNPLAKEACEETDLNMSESAEDINLSNSSNVEINEKAITSLKDEDQEKDQVSVSAEDQGKDNDTNSQHVASEEEGLQEQKGKFIITSESIDKDTEEIKISDEAKEKMEQQGFLHVITADVCISTKTEPIEETTGSEEKNDEEAKENDDVGQTKKLQSPLFKEVCEVTSSEKADSEVQGGGDEATSSHNTSNEIKETTSGQHATTVAYFEEGLGVSSVTEEILKEEADNKSIDPQEELKQCENETMDKREEKTEESVDELVNSLTVDEGIDEDEVDAENKKIEAKLNAEIQDDRTEDISEMKDEVVSKEKVSLELGQPTEQNVAEVQACLVNVMSENSENKIKKEDGDSSHENVEGTNDNTAKEEKCTLEHEPVEEQHSGVDEVSKEKIISLSETTLEPQENITHTSSSEIPTEDTPNSEKEKAESEILPIEDLKTVCEVQIPEVVTKSEDLKEECLISETATDVHGEGDLTKQISSDEKTEQLTEIKQETVKEECEGTSLEKAEFEEELKLSDSSNMQINEKSMTSFKDDDQEKDREVNMSAEGHDKDNVSSSQNKISEEGDLQEKNYHNEDNDHEFGESKASVEKDTEEIKSSLGTNEYTEQKELLHVVTTDDCSSTHTEHKEETTEKEEKNDEVDDKSIDTQEAIEQHENETKEKREQKPGEPANSCSETVEGNIQNNEADAGNSMEIETKLNAENQAERGEDVSEMKDEAFYTEKKSTEIEQPKAQSVEEIEACLTETKSEKTENDITKKDEDISHDNIEVRNENSIKEEKSFLDGRTRELEISTIEHEPVEEQTSGPHEVSKENFTNLHETAVEAQEVIKPSSSLGTSAEDVEYVSDVQSPEVMPMSEDSKQKEECLSSETTTYVDEEKETATKEIPSDENPEPYGSSTQQSENLNNSTDENVTQSGKIGEINSVYEKEDSEEDVTQENEVNSKEYCSDTVKDVILTEEVPLEIEKENGTNDNEEQAVVEDNSSTELQKISAQNEKDMTHEMSSSDPIPARNPDATAVKVEAKEDISCESKVKNDVIDEEPKEEKILSLESAAAIKPQVDLSNIESTDNLSESEKLATQVLDSVCDVQTPEVVADSADSKVKEECVVLATDEYMDENKVEEEQKTRTCEILSASDSGEENVKQAPSKSDEVKSGDLSIEEKALTKEDLELYGELKLTSDLMLEEDRAIETEPQPEQRDISENITSDQTLESKLEHTSKKHLEDEKRDIKEDVTLTPESRIESIENQDETTKNVILTDVVATETLNESGRSEVIGQISKEDNCPKELDIPSAPDHKDLENKIEYSKQIPSGNTEATEVKAESQIEPENIQTAEDLSCLSNTFSIENKKEAPTLEFEKKERDEELISEIQTPESILKMEMKQEHRETKKDTCETLISGNSSEKKLVPIVPPEASTNLTDDLPEASPKLLLAEQDQEITTTTEKIEDNINDEDGTVVNMYSSTSTKEVACLSNEKNGEIQLSTLDSEIDEGKKNGSGDMTNIEREAVQPQEHICNINFVDPPSDVEIREQAEDPVILHSAEKDIIQGVDKRFDEASVSDVQKHEKDFDHEGTNTETAIPVEDVKKPDVELKSDMDATADKAEKGVLKEDVHFESTCDGSKTTEEVLQTKQEKLELDSPVTPGIVAIEDLEISQKSATDDLIIISHVQAEIQKNKVSDCNVDEQSANKPHQNESTESKLLDGKINAPQEQGEPITESLIAEAAEDLKSTKASGTKPQCSSETFKEEKKTNDKKEKSETTEPAKILFADVLHEPTKGNSEVAQNLIGERELVVTKDQGVDKEEIGDSEVKTDEENEEDEDDNEDNQKTGSCSDAPVMVEASKDMDPKVHKKSHNILSGVGSKVKHSIAKVKKAITGKSSNSKPASPKEKDQAFA